MNIGNRGGRDPVAVLGSTGSIGSQALEVMEAHGIWPSVLTANKNAELAEEQARRFRPGLVCMADERAGKALKLKLADTDIPVLYGEESLLDAARTGTAVLNGLVGMSGLRPTLAALESGRNVLLANKETLVCGGALVTGLAREKGLSVIPVDSEHSAIFQCLQAGRQGLKRVILTASGGAFLNWSRERLETVTPEMAKRHPNWNMGAKVTVDSATLFNKGLELIEAMWLFGLERDKVSVVIHPESIIHSLIEYDDGAMLAQLGAPDMRLPIQYALLYPERRSCPGNSLDLCQVSRLTFLPPDLEAFPCLAIAGHQAAKGGNAGAVLNSAGEWAVERFLSGGLRFLEIPEAIEKAVRGVGFIEEPSLEDILNTDKEVRDFLGG